MGELADETGAAPPVDEVDVRDDLNREIGLARIHGHAFRKQFHKIADGIHAQAQGSAPPASLAGREARISLARSRFMGLPKRKAYPESHWGKRAGEGSACF